MVTRFELIRSRERLTVGAHFLAIRPKIAALAGVGNILLLASSEAPLRQKVSVAAVMGATLAGFFIEAWWLERHRLSERWLFISLSLTLLVLAFGAGLSGGIESPILPLLFAPVVVGFAAFARARPSALLFGVALLSLALIACFTPLAAFPHLPSPIASYMTLISAVASLALLALGVTGLVGAHERVAEELDRMRADMLRAAERRAESVELLSAQVAHEVKNPLTAVRGLVQLAQRKTIEPRDRERLSVIIQEVDRALEVLKGYLNFARPLSELSLAEVDVRALLQDIAGVLEARADEHSVVMHVSGDSIFAWADRQRVRDALLNLALNSINAMPTGGRLELRVQESGGRVRIIVEDNGVGMSAAMLSQVGRPFASETEGGTGLGVVVASGVARQHGGRLDFESSPGKGTRALLELPRGTLRPNGA